MTADEILAQLEELDEDIADCEQELEALTFLQTLYYLEDEGFIEIDGEYVFPAGEACLLN